MLRIMRKAIRRSYKRLGNASICKPTKVSKGGAILGGLIGASMLSSILLRLDDAAVTNFKDRTFALVMAMLMGVPAGAWIGHSIAASDANHKMLTCMTGGNDDNGEE